MPQAEACCLGAPGCRRSISPHLPVTADEIADEAMGSNVRVWLEDSLWIG